ncbi:DUF4132 domain-containing protein [Actinocrispum wychmicini]|uniref:Uncharacterized protein DUF4132 n=1 Tax=Actinocrispum wychmicini TaxID=1213861 RepID=A0A4V2S5N5_9PSEU|nr:DUF4132 domain-containing protein [Actinocrispum wychmicini]TCO52850.1 uncharacterized protein DUF4132 [Actinocrispum wychmicini]
MTWLDATAGYQLRLEHGKVVCRNAKGKQLASVPASLKEDARVVQLRQLAEWLERHESECRETVDRWMVRSLPVPTAAVVEVWPDPAWRDALHDLVVTVDGESGFLRDAVGGRGVGVVTVDGDTVWSNPELVGIPHPVLLADLDELREFGAELGVEQKVQQLFRQTFAKDERKPGANAVSDFADGRFAQLSHVTGRSRTLGYPVRGGYATYMAFEDGRAVEARYWVGSDHPESFTYTGDLVFTTADGGQLPLADVGPVAWSEGMRMASLLYAGRVVAEAA